MQATRTEMVRARISPALKTSAERILSSLGMNPSQAIVLFYKRAEGHIDTLALVPALSPLPERVPELTTCQKIALSVPFSDETLWTVQRGCIVVAVGATAGAVGAAVGSVPAAISALGGGAMPARSVLPVLR